MEGLRSTLGGPEVAFGDGAAAGICANRAKLCALAKALGEEACVSFVCELEGVSLGASTFLGDNGAGSEFTLGTVEVTGGEDDRLVGSFLVPALLEEGLAVGLGGVRGDPPDFGEGVEVSFGTAAGGTVPLTSSNSPPGVTEAW